jgi:hypothetical protein
MSTLLREQIAALRAADPGAFDAEYDALLQAERAADLAALVVQDAARHLEECRDTAQAAYIAKITSAWKTPVVAVSKHAKRGRQPKYLPQVIGHVWVRVQFLKWRDGTGVRAICEKLAATGLRVAIYDTPDGNWNGENAPGGWWNGEGDNPEAVRIIRAEGEVGHANGENLRAAFYKFAELEPEVRRMNRWQLGQFKAAWLGDKSVYTRQMLEVIFPVE